uniref:5'-3' exoribonuclease 4 n=2 Tax=Anthurium amnicola TaxID=1678845 RepID=A0A1D1YQ69_9ARAE
MANNHSPELDDDGDDDFFKEVYGKEYTGPPRSTNNSATDKVKPNKRLLDGTESDKEDEPLDPNAVPTDFTSREAKVWEAKAKAIERNWKKRKEEELICKICGESGHFTQGCPSTLGPNRKSADFFERVPARDKNMRDRFSEKVIQQIEKDVGCKIKMDDKFLIVSGKDRLILAKGVDAVHKVIQGEGEDKGKSKGPSSSQRPKSKSPDRSPAPPRKSWESQRSHPSPRSLSYVQRKGFIQEKVVEDQLREDLQKMSRGSPKAYGNNGVKRRPAQSKSPTRPTFAGDAFNSHDAYRQTTDMHKTDRWEPERRGMDALSGHHNFPFYAQTLEELETEFKKEAMEVGTYRDKEEDEENYRHRECIRELRENYMKKLEATRALHTKQWDEFLQLGFQRQQRAHQHLEMSGYAVYNQTSHPDFDRPDNLRYMGGGRTMDSRSRYQYPGEEYPAPSAREAYGEFHNQRHEDFEKAYGRY